MADSDLSISQLPPLTLPVQGSDLLHIARGGEDYRISRTELVRTFLSQMADAAISGATSGHSLVYNSTTARWENGFISWATISGKPSQFTPVAHTHIWAEIADAPTDLPAAPHTHPWSDLTDVPTAFPPEAHGHAWGDLTGIPTTFPPEIHGHAWAQITDKPLTFPPNPHDHNSLYYSKAELNTSGAGSEVHWDNITSKPETFGSGDMSKSVYDQNDDGMVDAAPWTGITGKPATFPPDAHDHDDRYFTETELTMAGGGGSVHWDNITGKPLVFGAGDMEKSVYDQNNDGIVDAAPWSGITGKPATFPSDPHDHDNRYFTETELNTSGGGGAVHWDNVTNKPALGGGGDMTKTVYDQNNDGVVDAAETVPWSGITGKPATFPPDTHTHSNIVQDQIAAASYMDALGLMSNGGDILPILLNGTNALKKTSLDDIGEVLAFNNFNARYARVSHNHDHRTLSYIGSNTHEAIDQHISSPAPHSGHAYTNHWHQSKQVLVHHLNSVTVAAGATSYITLSIPGYTGLNGVVWPTAGDMQNLTVRTNSIQPASGSLVFTLQKGLQDTTCVATVPANAAASTQWYDTTHPITFIAGELLSIKVKNNATAASCQITTVSWEFRPSTV